MRRRDFLRTGASVLTAAATFSSRSLWAANAIAVVYYNEFAPFSFEGPDGRITGILVDGLEQTLGGLDGVSLTHEGYPWTRAQALVKAGRADALITNPTAARREYANFSEEYLAESGIRIFFAADHPRADDIRAIQSIEDLRDFRQVDFRGNGFAEREFKGLTIEWQTTLNVVMKLLAYQRADIFVGNDMVGRHVIRAEGLRGQIESIPMDLGRVSRYHLGIRKSYPGVDTILAAYDAEVRAAKADGGIQAVIDSYL